MDPPIPYLYLNVYAISRDILGMRDETVHIGGLQDLFKGQLGAPCCIVEPGSGRFKSDLSADLSLYSS